MTGHSQVGDLHPQGVMYGLVLLEEGLKKHDSRRVAAVRALSARALVDGGRVT